MAVMTIQLTGFAPEMIAMAKKHFDVRTSAVRIPEEIVNINKSYALTDGVSIPYKPELDSVWTFNTLTNNIFRKKNIDRRYFCNGTVDPNNLVYLNSEDTGLLRMSCKAAHAAESPARPDAQD